MKAACFAIPALEEYPWRAALQGLERCGYPAERQKTPGDLLVTWSPWIGSHRHALAELHRQHGRPVIVVENGWLNPVRGVPTYQVALDGWNGTGRFPAGDAERWESWNLPFVEWAPAAPAEGGCALVIGQRGHPTDSRTAPPGWHERVAIPHSRVVRRGRGAQTPLFEDLKSASECHVWTSSAASWALLMGVPVVQHGPNLMVGELASRPGEPLRRPPNRAEVFARLSGAQWTEAELASGEPFARCLELVG